MRSVRASAKGQLTIPKELFNALGGAQDLVLIQEGRRIVIVPAADAARSAIDDLGGWERLSAPAFLEVWDNEADEVWNDA